MQIPPLQNPTTHQYLGINPAGFHNLTYYAWGNPANPPLLMVHGLSRLGRDFDAIAKALSGTHYVICPDMVGRGKSDWLPEGQTYTYTQYMNDLNALIAHITPPNATPEATPPQKIDFLGTSMGGLLGMIMASMPNTPITRLLINDIGPFITNDALKKIRSYVGLMPTFQTFDVGVTFIRQIYAPFGNLTDDQWHHLALHSLTQQPNSTYRLHYDPRIAHFKMDDDAADVNLWPCWLSITCPTLVLRGNHSEIFPADVAAQMMVSNPHATFTEIPNAGHAPALMSEFEINIVRNWFCS